MIDQLTTDCESSCNLTSGAARIESRPRQLAMAPKSMENTFTASNRIKQLNDIDKVRPAMVSREEALRPDPGYSQVTSICRPCYQSSHKLHIHLP